MHMTKMIKSVSSDVAFFCPYSALTRSASLFAEHLDLVHNWCEPYLQPLLRLRYLYLAEPPPRKDIYYIYMNKYVTYTYINYQKVHKDLATWQVTTMWCLTQHNPPVEWERKDFPSTKGFRNQMPCEYIHFGIVERWKTFRLKKYISEVRFGSYLPH